MASPENDRVLGRWRLRRDPEDPCLCGHPRKAHEHLRPGSDCSLCPAAECPRFRRSRGGPA